MAFHTVTGFEQITSLSTVKQLTVPDGTHYAWLNAEVQNVRYRLDGEDPTVDIGGLIIAGAHEPLVIADVNGLKAMKIIEDAASAKLNVHYFGNTD